MSNVFRRSQIGPEAVGAVGDAVVPTYQLSGALTMKNAPERRLRESRRATMFGPNLYDDMSFSSTGSYTGRFVYNEAPFFLAGSIRGDQTPAAARWTYSQPGPAPIVKLKSLTAYCGDDEKALRAAGVFTSRLEITGADTDWWRINATLLGRELIADDNDVSKVTDAFAGGLSTGVALGAKNKKTILSIDDTGAGIGTTHIVNTGYRFRYVFDPKIGPDFSWAAGSLDMTDITRDVPEVTLELTMKWVTATVDEFRKYRTRTPRFVRLSNVSEVSGFDAVIDGAYVYTDFEPLAEERDGIQLGRLMLTAVEDTTWGKKTEVSVLNTLTATDLPVV